VRGDVLTEAKAPSAQIWLTVTREAEDLVPLSVADEGGSVRGKLAKVFLLCQLRSLFIHRLALCVQVVPHRSNALGDISEAHVRSLALYARLTVSKEEGIGRDWLLRLIGVSLLLPTRNLRLLGDVGVRGVVWPEGICVRPLEVAVTKMLLSSFNLRMGAGCAV